MVNKVTKRTILLKKQVDEVFHSHKKRKEKKDRVFCYFIFCYYFIIDQCKLFLHHTNCCYRMFTYLDFLD